MVETLQHTGIVIKAMDYKEYDKLMKILTVDGGIITAVIKGVKKPKAKLKFACQPFSFCEFTVTKRTDFYTVINASQIESLHALTNDIDKFMCASLMLEGTEYAVGDTRQPDKFIQLLTFYKALIYTNTPPYTTASVYFYNLYKDAGYVEKGGAVDKFFGKYSIDNLPSEEIENSKKALGRIVELYCRDMDITLTSAKLLL